MPESQDKTALKNIKSSRQESKSPARPCQKKWSHQTPELQYCVLPYSKLKTAYILAVFNYYREVHSTTILTLCESLFGGRPRRRFALVSPRLNIFWRGFVLRPRHEVYSTNFASLRHRLHACKNHPEIYSKPPFMCGAGTTYRNASSYDDAVENIVLTQENFIFFTRNVHKLRGDRFRTARRLFYDLMTSAEPQEKTASEKSSFPSNAVHFSARRCLEKGGHSNQCISDAKSKDFLYKLNNINDFCMDLLQKSRL